MKEIIEDFIAIVVGLGVLLIVLVLLAYIGFGFGATIGVLAGGILDVSTAFAAKLFAWVFVGLGLVVHIKKTPR